MLLRLRFTYQRLRLRLQALFCCTLVYDAGRDVNEHSYMADFFHAAMDTAALLALIDTPEPGSPVVLSATP